MISSGVVSDSDSEDEYEDYFPVDSGKIFDYRVLSNMRTRPENTPGQHKQHPSGDQSAMVAAAQQASGGLQRQTSTGSAS